ncbi:MAG: transketolase C-terminal domain-containing protein [Clostridiales bacterium]|nr:transketolase C-terminal domain-containing protein [Clostridiales bacterium]
MEEMRESFGKQLIKLGKEYFNMYVLDADLNSSTRTVLFMENFPKRFLQLGIAEQNMVGVAAGLALEGKIPIACTFADFLTKRACDQISISVAYPRLNVKLAGAYPGLFTGKAGATHQAIQDLANMRAMPNMRVVAPCDNYELSEVMKAMMEYCGPVYFRISRQRVSQIIPGGAGFEWGKGIVLQSGNDVTLVGTGLASQWALQAARELAKQGIGARMLHMSCLKPFDRELMLAAARETGAVVTVENHSIIGGLGSATAEVLAEEYPVPVQRIGIRDQFTETGADDDLIKKYGLTIDDIIDAAKRAISVKISLKR